MSFYSDASLVLIPSGVKASKVYSQKPTDGTGDLTLTRASIATRTNSAGLIEKVHTNILLQSNTFSNASWAKDGTTLTGGQAGYDGTNNAWLLDKIALDFRFINQSVTISGTYVFSVYAKANTLGKITLRDSSSQTVEFNLSTGTIVSQLNGAVGTIVSVGGGWYRCSVVMTTTNPSPQIYPDWTGLTAGSILIQNAQVQTGDVASAYIPTTTAAVTTGATNNVPRLDYSGGATCPSLLLEPQRTNLILQSESFDNASWTKATASVTANNSVSPDGTTNADLITTTAVNGYVFPSNTNVFAAAAGSAFSYSVYLKAGTASTITILVSATATYTAVFNLSTGVATTSTANTTASMSSVGNGWYRCIIVCSSVANSAYSELQIGRVASGLTFSAWGVSLEQGSFVSSYIPTTTAAVTRLADLASKTGISSLIGQTEGTMFFGFNLTRYNDTKTLGSIDVGDISNFITITISSGIPRFTVRQSGSSTLLFSSTQLAFGNHKLAVGYKSGDYVMYINGTQVGTSSSTIYPVGTLTRYALSNSQYGDLADSYNQAALFPPRLTNAQLAELTTL